MKLLRFGEPDDNSSLRAINLRQRIHKELAADLRLVLKERSMPQLDPNAVTFVEDWTIEQYTCPMLVGKFRYPSKRDGLPVGWLSFSNPLELLSLDAKVARSLTQWYRLGEPSPLAKNALEIWSFPNGR